MSLLASTAIFSPVAFANDAEPSKEAVPQDEIVVTAPRSGSTLKQLPISVSVVDEVAVNSQLRQNRNILTGPEFVVPGLSVQNGETRGSCSSAIRGRAASFQIHAVPVNEDLRPGSCTGPFTISPFSVERVEVVRGGTALYGAGAPGGIINLITRRAKSGPLEVDATGQTTFNTANADDTFTTNLYAGIGQKRGNLDYYVGATYTDGGRVRSANGLPVFSAASEPPSIRRSNASCRLPTLRQPALWSGCLAISRTKYTRASSGQSAVGATFSKLASGSYDGTCDVVGASTITRQSTQGRFGS